MSFVWVPAHVGIEGNEEADMLAKQSLRQQNIDLQFCLSKAEGKTLIKRYSQKLWQEAWELAETGRHLFSIQKQVGKGREVGRNRKEETTLTRLRIGHTGLNETLYRISKHADGRCYHCGETESVQHVLMECESYEEERKILRTKMEKDKDSFHLRNLLQVDNAARLGRLMDFIRDTRLIDLGKIRH